MRSQALSALRNRFVASLVHDRRQRARFRQTALLMSLERLEDRTLLSSINREQGLYEPPWQPSSCWEADPWFDATYSVPQSVADNGGPFPTLTFEYSVEDPANPGQFFVYSADVSQPYDQSAPFQAEPGIWCVDLKYRHRFLDAAAEGSAPTSPIDGEYSFEVTEGQSGGFAGPSSFDYSGDTSGVPSAVSGLSISGSDILTPESGHDAIALLEEEGETTTVTISWAGDSNADYYVYELWWLPVDPETLAFPDEYTLHTGPASVVPPTTQVTFSDLEFGVYVFTVDALNCGGEGGSALRRFAVSDPLLVSVLDNFENQCTSCGTDQPPTFDAGPVGVGARTGDLVSPVAAGATGSLSDATIPVIDSSGNPHPVATVSFRLMYDTNDVTLDATYTTGSQSNEPPITEIDGAPITAIDSASRVLLPGQLSVPAGVSRLADADFDLTFDMPLPNLPDGTAVGTFIGSIEPTAKVPVRDWTSSPFGRRVGVVIDDFLDTSLVGNGGAPVLIRGNATIVEYSGNGSTSWDSPLGSFTTIARPGGAGNDFVVTDALGNEWEFDGTATTSNGVLKEIRAWTGEKTVFYRHNTDKNGDGVLNDLDKVEYIGPDGTSVMDRVTYGWTGSNITSITDFDGRVWSYTYGANNLLDCVTGPPTDSVTGLVDVPALKIAFEYVTADSTYPLESIEWTDVTAAISEVTAFEFDQWRNVTTVTRESSSGDRVWQFDSAESKLLDGVYVEIAGDEAEPEPNDVIYVSGPEDTITLPNGDVVRREADIFGNTVKETHNYSNSGYGGARQAITELHRNAHGQLLKSVGTYFAGEQGAALETEFTYDSSRRLTDIAYPDGSAENWTYVLAGPHQPDTYTNRVGHKTTYGYNTDGQQTSAVVKNGTAFMEQTHTTWSGMMVATVTLPSTNGGGSSDANRPAIKYFYDDRGRLIHTRRTSAGALSGSPLSSDIWVSQEYDGSGNLAWITSEYSDPTLDGDGLPIALDNTVKTEFINSAIGGVRKLTLPDPDGAGSQTRPEYVYSIDALTRVLTATDAGPGSAADRTTTQTWNDFGELDTSERPDPDDDGITDGPLDGTTTSYHYDSLGNLRSIDTAATGGSVVWEQFFKYNSRGELEWESLPYGSDQTTAGYHDRSWFDYDEFSRVVRQDVQSGVTGTTVYQITQWEYDDVNRIVTMTDALGSEWETRFDAIGRVTKTTTPDPDGIGSGNPALVTDIQYFDGNNAYGIVGTYARIDGPRDTASDYDWVKYNSYGQVLLDEPLDPDGAGATPRMWTRFSYDQFGRLDDIGERYGSTFSGAASTERATEYEYNARGQTTEITTPDPDGAGSLSALTTTWVYDNLARNTSITYPSGMAMNYEWRDDGLLDTESRTDNDSDSDNDWSAVYKYDHWDRVISITTPGVLSGEDDPETVYAYNQRGDLLSETLPDPDGSDTEQSFVTTYAYDATNAGIFVESITTSATSGTSTTEFVHDRAGRLREQYRPDPVTGNAVTSATEKWTWDKLNGLTSESKVKSIATGTYTYDTLTYTWDTLSRITNVSDGTRSVDTEYEGDGDIDTVTDAIGVEVEYEWDHRGRLTDESRMLGASVNDTTHTTFDGFGRISDVTENYNLSSSEHLITSWTYDNLDRVTTKKNALRLPVASVTTYDWNDDGHLDTITNEYGQPLYIERDNVGRITQTRFYNDLEQMDYTYDAYDRVVTKTDANDNTTTSVYDNAGRMIQSVGPSVGSTPVTVTYEYDTPGNLISLTDAVGNETAWQYDKRNRMRFETVSVESNDESRELQYYLNDTLRWASDRDGDWRFFKYDFVLGDYQITQERWLPAGTQSFSYDINYEYGAGNGMLLTDVFESAAGAGDVDNHIEFTYDGLGRIDLVRSFLTGHGATAAQSATSSFTTFDIEHEWDTLDRRDSSRLFFSDESSAETEEIRNDYDWDKLHRLETLTQEVSSATSAWTVDSARTRVAAFEYYANSQLKEISRTQGSNTNELGTEYKQNSGDDWWIPGRVSKVEHSGLTQGNQLTEYDFDVAGRIIQKVTPDETYNYDYDDIDQLSLVTDASSAALQDPDFDEGGNETTFDITDLNRIEDDGTYSYEYDLEGNRTKRTHNTSGSYDEYEWDFRQRLTSVTSYNSSDVKTQEVVYAYDALNRRIRRKVDTDGNGSYEVNQRLLYDTNVIDPSYHEVVQIIDGSDEADITDLTREHRFLNGPYPDMVLVDEVFTSSGTPDDILWLLHDHQNTVTDVATIPTSGSAELENHIEYDAFGKITSQSDSNYQPLQTYTGQIQDDATGLLYYDARWFDPRINRFVSEDPIGFAAGDPNLRRYVGNSNPNAVDPTGLDMFMIGAGMQASEVEALRRSRRTEFRDAMVRTRQAIEMINLRARLMNDIVAEDLADDGCLTQTTLDQFVQLAEGIGELTHAYLANRDRALELGSRYYGYGVTAADVTEFLRIGMLPSRILQGLGPEALDSPFQGPFNDRIGQEREFWDTAERAAGTVNNVTTGASWLLGGGALFVQGVRVTMSEGGKVAARQIGRQLAIIGTGVAVGHGVGKGLDAACEFVDADEVTRAWVTVGFDIAAAIALRRRAPRGSAFDLNIARGTRQQMLDAVRKLDAADPATKLSADDIAGLTENARLVAKKYWELKGTARTAQSVQNQLNRPRWRFLDQAPEAQKIIQEIIDDFGG